ncbi:MAG: hypothetical protein ACD_76C00100G0001 [uncultured bacterium]|nr:MAG: hypothetical protein ACD_76C00100G0001 [uncultured bacterium]HBD05689.1 hypothetical protein [Candidatus Uhrbacteria bacterium]
MIQRIDFGKYVGVIMGLVIGAGLVIPPPTNILDHHISSVVRNTTDCNRNNSFELVYADTADLLYKLMDIKDMCGWVQKPEQYVACWSMPIPSFAILNTLDCNDMEEDNKRIRDWLEAVSPPIKKACDNDKYCRSWFLTRTDNNSTPVLGGYNANQ